VGVKMFINHWNKRPLSIEDFLRNSQQAYVGHDFRTLVLIHNCCLPTKLQVYIIVAESSDLPSICKVQTRNSQTPPSPENLLAATDQAFQRRRLRRHIATSVMVIPFPVSLFPLNFAHSSDILIYFARWIWR